MQKVITATAIYSFVMAKFIQAAGIRCVCQATMIGGIFSLGFVVPSILNQMAFERRSYVLLIIDTVFYAISYAATAAIVTYLQ